MVNKILSLSLLVVAGVNTQVNAMGMGKIAASSLGAAGLTGFALYKSDVKPAYATGAALVAGTAIGSILMHRSSKAHANLLLEAGNFIKTTKANPLMQGMISPASYFDSTKNRCFYYSDDLSKIVKQVYPSSINPHHLADRDFKKIVTDGQKVTTELTKAEDFFDLRQFFTSIPSPEIETLKNDVYKLTSEAGFRSIILEEYLQ